MAQHNLERRDKVVATLPRRPQGSRSARTEALLAGGLVAPAAAFIVLVIALPVIFSFAYSFTKLNYTQPTGFAGLDNWERAVFVPQTLPLLGRTLVFAVGAVIVALAVSLPIAYLLDRLTSRMSTVLQLVVIVPWVTSQIVASLLFRWTMLDNLGIVSFVAHNFGVNWSPLESPGTAMASIVVVAAWRTSGFAVLLLLAGLKGIDSQLYESARVDGASRLQEFFHVAMPGIRTQLTIVTVVLFLSALNNVEVPLSVTNGGPGGATRILPLEIYQLAFVNFDYAGATAMAAAAMILNVTLVVIYLKLTFRRWES